MNPDPDFTRLETVLRRSGLPDRVPFFELYSNIQPQVLSALGRTPSPSPEISDRKERWGVSMAEHITYMLELGYDYINASASGFVFPRTPDATALTRQGERSYVMAGNHTIGSREEFEQYSWPEPSTADYRPLEWVEKIMPRGMKVIAGSSGVLENVMWLLGYEGISYLLADDRQLVADMFDSVGSRLVEYNARQADFDSVGAVVMGEDMGFKTGTLLSPDIYRELLFPWHKRLVEAVHERGKPIILHSCGNLGEVMGDIIACRWDARHSFEDAIEPVWAAKEKYGSEISLLGGFDMDKISRMTIAEVRAHTRVLMERCAPGGGWCLGTGNTVANYIPVDNFLAMLDEGRSSNSNLYTRIGSHL